MVKKSLALSVSRIFNSLILKNGSYSDLPLSIKPDNIYPMIVAGTKNIPLTKYLIQQVRQSPNTAPMLLENMCPKDLRIGFLSGQDKECK
jgi:malate dehydrogenase (quinone)